jgi:small conductance mechanosensitive channel
LEIFGIENFTENTVTIRARFKTRPAEQYSVSREFRRRLKYALHAAGLLDPPAAPAAPRATPALTPPAT